MNTNLPFKINRLASIDLDITCEFDNINTFTIEDVVDNAEDVQYYMSFAFADTMNYSANLIVSDAIHQIQNLLTIVQKPIRIKLRLIIDKPVQYEIKAIKVDNLLIADEFIAITDTSAFRFNIVLPESENRFSPYANMNNAIELNYTMVEQVSEIFGHPFLYCKVIDDKVNDTFKTIEQMSVSDTKWVKCLVPDNDFKDNALVYAEHNIEYELTLEIHITVEEFQKKFGPDTMPEAFDYFVIPELYRIYEVTSAHAKKDFMHQTYYYVLTCKKYKKRGSVDNAKEDKTLFDIDTVRDFNIDLYHEVANPDTKSKKSNKILTDAISESINAAGEHMYYELSLHDFARTYVHTSIKHAKTDMCNGNVKFSSTQYVVDKNALQPNGIAILYRNRFRLDELQRTMQLWFVARNKMSGYLLKFDKIYCKFDYDLTNDKLYLTTVFDPDSQNIQLSKLEISVSTWYNLAIQMNLETLTIDIALRINDNKAGFGTPKIKILKTEAKVLPESTYTEDSGQIALLFGSYAATNIRVYSKIVEPKIILENCVMMKANTQNSILIDNASKWK